MLRVYYVLDKAELRAFEDRDAIAADRSGYGLSQLAAIATGLRVRVRGVDLALTATQPRVDLVPGQGGLNTVRVSAVFVAPLVGAAPEEVQSGEIVDGNEPTRIGWREVVVVARSDAVVVGSSAPSADASDELRHYPASQLQAPLDHRGATFQFREGTRSVAALELRPPVAAVSRAGGTLTKLIERQRLSFAVVVGMLGVAFAFGCGHAVAPGHGKTVMASYLIGTRGRSIDAVFLGLIVSLMHTGSVILLGIVLFQVDRLGAIDRIYPVLTVASGLAVGAYGLTLAAQRIRALRRRPSAAHDHGHHHEGHGETVHDHNQHNEHDRLEAGYELLTDDAPAHRHDEEHGRGASADHDHHGGTQHLHGPGGHTHDLPEGTAPLSRRGLVLLATSGGLVPSPSAVLVVVAGFAARRIALALGLVLAFSVGLAATLTAIGAALVLGRNVVERRAGRSIRYLPAAGAFALVGVGAVLVFTGSRAL